MNKIRYIIFIIIACPLVYLSYRVYVYCKANYEVRKMLTAKSYIDKIASYEDDKIDSNTIVFLGNSLIDDFDLSVFNNPHVINRGISGDYTEGIKGRMSRISHRHPKKVFIEIGINDLVEKVSLKVMRNNYDSILYKFNHESPHTQVYIFSLLPTMLPGTFFTSRDNVNKRVMKFNNILKQFPEKYHCTYIDLWSHFALKDNSMKPELTNDGIHLTPEGYKLWASTIAGFVN